jgi:hypothetical protein
VDIASNESADNHRECTLQVLIRCIPYRVGVPRGGQPKLSIIFRGKGGSFFDKERELYHKDVLVSFQKKVMFLLVHALYLICCLFLFVFLCRRGQMQITAKVGS